MWTDTVTNPLQSMFENTFSAGPLHVSFLSVAANSYISKGNRNFSSALKLLPNKKRNNKHLFHGNVTRIELENLAAVEKHFIPPSILPFHSVRVETHVTCCCCYYGKQWFSLQHREQYWVLEVLLGVSLLPLAFGRHFESFVCSIFPVVGKQVLEAVMAYSHLAGPLDLL